MKRNGIPLPQSFPTGTRCVPVMIPDDPAYIDMFIAAVSALGQQRSYQRDEYYTGKYLASLWNDMTITPLLSTLTQLQGCDMTFNCTDWQNCADNNTEYQLTVQRAQNNTTALTYTNAVINNMYTRTIQQNTTINEAISTPVPDTPSEPNLCKDSLWSGCLAIADMVNNGNMDFLERLNAQLMNTAGRFADLIDMIPVFGALAEEFMIKDILEFSAKLADVAYNNYISSVTDDTIKNTACALFNANCMDCTVPTFKALADYHASFLTASNLANIANTLYDIVSIILTQSFTTEQWYHAVSYMQLWVLLAEESWLGKRGTGWIRIAYLTGKNSPDNDWTIWCGDCTPPPVDITPFQYDYRNGQLGSTRDGGTTYGGYTLGQGYTYYNGSFWERLWINHSGLPSISARYIYVYDTRTEKNGYGGTLPLNIIVYNAAGTILKQVGVLWDQLQIDENGLKYRIVDLGAVYNGIAQVKIRCMALNSGNVATWRFQGWGYKV